MSGIELRIMMRACTLRVRAGETLEGVLASYTRLTDADRAQIMAAMENG